MVDKDFVRGEEVNDQIGTDCDLWVVDDMGLEVEMNAADAEVGSMRFVRFGKKNLVRQMFGNQKDLVTGVRMFLRNRPWSQSAQ